MWKRNLSWFKLLAFCLSTALVAGLALAILLASASLALAAGQGQGAALAGAAGLAVRLADCGIGGAAVGHRGRNAAHGP